MTKLNIFKDKSKFFFFNFLPDTLAAIISAILMFGVLIGNYYLNIMIKDQYTPFVENSAYYSIIIVLCSFPFFFIGLILKKNFVFYIFSTIYSMYLSISWCFYYYNIVTLIFSGFYTELYNVYDYLTYLYLTDHSELDYDAEYYNIRSKLKTKYYIESFIHLFVLILMVYYHSVLSEYIERKRLEYSGELEQDKLLSNSKFQGTIKNSNMSLDNTQSKSSKIEINEQK